MLKGVNRQVVDIPQPESAYFERAIFFVKPEYAGMSESRLRAKADEMVKNVCAPPASARTERMSKTAKILRLLISAAAGAGVTLAAEMLMR